MGRARRLVTLLGVAGAGLAVLQHGRGGARGRRVRGGILIGDAAAYDALSHRLLLGPLFRRIAADIAAVAPDGARVLEVGCGPGRLSLRLACQHGLDVTGLDLDPAMIERARANADRLGDGERRRPSFVVGDVASLTFPDGSFDLVVSTLSMTTGPTRRRAWPSSAACCAQAAGRLSGTSGLALCHSTDICPSRTNKRVALRCWW